MLGQASPLLFLKALEGINGKVLPVKREVASPNGIQVERLHCRKEASGSDGNLRLRSVVSKLEEQQEISDDLNCQKTLAKEQINISIRQDQKELCESDHSSRRVSVVSRTEGGKKLKQEANFQRTTSKEDNICRQSGKEDSRTGDSSRCAPVLSSHEVESELKQEPESQEVIVKEDINTSIGQNKKKRCRSDSILKIKSGLSELGELKPEKESSKQQCSTVGESACTRLNKKESCKLEKRLRGSSDVSRHKGDKLSKQSCSSQKIIGQGSSICTKEKTETKVRSRSPSSIDDHTDNNNQFVNFQRTVVVKPLPKLVFVDEQDLEENQKVRY